MSGKRYRATISFRNKECEVEMYVAMHGRFNKWVIGFNSPATGRFRKSHYRFSGPYDSREQAEHILATYAEQRFLWPEVKENA